MSSEASRGSENDADADILCSLKKPRLDISLESTQTVDQHMQWERQPIEEYGCRSGPWRSKEDEALTMAVSTHKLPNNTINWGLVSKDVGDRSQEQCHVRWSALLKYRGEGSRRCDWSEQEDALLQEAAARHSRPGGGVYVKLIVCGRAIASIGSVLIDWTAITAQVCIGVKSAKSLQALDLPSSACADGRTPSTRHLVDGHVHGRSGKIAVSWRRWTSSLATAKEGASLGPRSARL